MAARAGAGQAPAPQTPARPSLLLAASAFIAAAIIWAGVLNGPHPDLGRPAADLSSVPDRVHVESGAAQAWLAIIPAAGPEPFIAPAPPTQFAGQASASEAVPLPPPPRPVAVAPPPVPAGVVLTHDQLEALLCGDPFTWPCEWAINLVTNCESGGNPNAQGVEYLDLNGDGVPERYEFNGLFQVVFGPFDPYENAVEAHIQYVQWINGERSRSPWPSCSPEKPV